MAYQVLARKWRPQRFEEVVGQEHITKTLKNAIINNRIGHAYLFVGSRGIGKTTTARIFAKALNCPNNHDGEPCCQCESCLEIAKGSSMDVIEIDGASHNKAEDIRDLRENVQYAPSHGRYKIYIIDEVHMLSTAAWNALLKTLEEPPPHVKFLFATTEPHKVLPTIISRCQRFDLKRIPVPLIMHRLRQIADAENLHVDDAALSAVARAADGGMRDAQSIFDQMIAFCGGFSEDERITENDVIDVFGLASGFELRAIATAIFQNDINAALKILQKLSDTGRDLERLYGDLIGFIRNIMVASLCSSSGDILEVSESELQDLKAIGKVVDPMMVQRVLQTLVAQEWSFKSAFNKRIYFEATLAKIITEAHSVQLDDIFRHLNRLGGILPQEPIPEKKAVVIPPPPVKEPERPFSSKPGSEAGQTNAPAVSAAPATPSQPTQESEQYGSGVLKMFFTVSQPPQEPDQSFSAATSVPIEQGRAAMAVPVPELVPPADEASVPESPVDESPMSPTVASAPQAPASEAEPPAHQPAAEATAEEPSVSAPKAEPPAHQPAAEAIAEEPPAPQAPASEAESSAHQPAAEAIAEEPPVPQAPASEVALVAEPPKAEEPVVASQSVVLPCDTVPTPLPEVAPETSIADEAPDAECLDVVPVELLDSAVPEDVPPEEEMAIQYRHGNFMETNQAANSPFLSRLNSILGTNVVDLRIPVKN